MDAGSWLTAAAATAFLGLALVAGLRRGASALTPHLGFMSVGLFVYNLTELLSLVDGSRAWVYLGDAAASLTAIATFELFVGFLGKSRELSRARWAGRLYFGALALAALSPLVRPTLAPFHDEAIWAICMLAGVIPAFGAVVVLLVRHLQKSQGPERARTQLLGGALLVGVGSIVIDLAGMPVAATFHVSYVGLLASAGLVAALTLKARLLEVTSISTLVTMTTLAALAVGALLTLFALAGDRTVVFVFGALVVVVALLAAIRPLVANLSEERARERYTATLGRFSRQMAHDIKNPLAAIRGAAQFLKEEVEQGRSIEPNVDLIDLIVERTDRITRLIDDYQRMGRLELVRGPVDVNALVKDTLRTAGSGNTNELRVETSLASDLPRVEGDRDLLSFALENLVKNAIEAMEGGGELVVSTSMRADHRGDRICLAVRDSGKGMDVRTRERALEGFFTTKADGSGLGLAFVARVAEAHAGDLRIDSEEGRGTTVALELPAPRSG